MTLEKPGYNPFRLFLLSQKKQKKLTFPTKQGGITPWMPHERGAELPSGKTKRVYHAIF